MARPKRRYKCRACAGTGYEACRACGGTGKRNVRKDQGRFRGHAGRDKVQPEVKSTECKRCGGTGHGASCPMPGCVDGYRES